MITAARLEILTQLTAEQLTQIIQKSGFKKDRFNDCKFVGMTNGNQFCYRATYTEDGEEKTTKVFVNYDSLTNKATADY